MTNDQISVLDLLSDDHFPLWDFADNLPVMRPDATDSQTALLIDLVEKGLVEITFGRWIENDTLPLPVEDARAALRNAASWNPTGREPGYVIELTEAGRGFLPERGIGLPL